MINFIIISLIVYSVIGLILMDLVLTKELSKSIDNNFLKKYCKKLLPTEVIINTFVKITKNIGEIFTVVVLGLLNIVWNLLSNIFDLVTLLFLWPYMIWKIKKSLKEFKLKNNIEG